MQVSHQSVISCAFGVLRWGNIGPCHMRIYLEMTREGAVSVKAVVVSDRGLSWVTTVVSLELDYYVWENPAALTMINCHSSLIPVSITVNTSDIMEFSNYS